MRKFLVSLLLIFCLFFTYGCDEIFDQDVPGVDPGDVVIPDNPPEQDPPSQPEDDPIIDAYDPHKSIINDLDVKAAFGDITWYSMNEQNPYGIDLSNYGNDVYVAFYESDSSTIDPYVDINTDDFYMSYKPSITYEDSKYRTMHHLMSGDIEFLRIGENHIPDEYPITLNNTGVRISTTYYVLDTAGNYIAYLLLDIDKDYVDAQVIFYGGGYISIEEEAAYLLAFGEVPPSSNYSKNSKSKAIADWGIYGRLNHSAFSGNTSNYPYQPALRNITKYQHYETDYGSNGNFYCGDGIVDEYNDGRNIERGTCRFVFTTKNTKKIDDRSVFYTYNHYNDFQEYYGYKNGWSIRFGNETSGNPYCYSSSDYSYSFNKPTPNPEIYISKINDLYLGEVLNLEYKFA